MSQSRATSYVLKPDKPRGRASRGDTRRREIMVAAEDVFLERGYGNTTMDDIVAREGASKATLYKQFGSKEAMFAEIVRERSPNLTEASSQVLLTDGALSTVLIDWSLHVLRLVTTPRTVALFKLILTESSRSPEMVRIYYEKGPAAAQADLAAFFKKTTAEGRLRCSDPELAATLLISAVFGEGFERALIGLAGEHWYERKAKAHVKEAVAMFLARYGVN